MTYPLAFDLLVLLLEALLTQDDETDVDCLSLLFPFIQLVCILCLHASSNFTVKTSSSDLLQVLINNK